MGLFGGGGGLLGGVMDSIFGGATYPEQQSTKLSQAWWENNQIQRYLPAPLRQNVTNPMLATGLAGIADLLRNPGGLSPTVSDAIRPQLAQESQSIAQNFRNLQGQNAGAAARGNAPTSIKDALAAALDVQQERAQREARGQALTQSDALRRQDLEQTYKLLDILLQYVASGRGQGIAGLGQAAATAQARQASQLEFLGQLASTIAGVVA